MYRRLIGAVAITIAAAAGWSWMQNQATADTTSSPLGLDAGKAAMVQVTVPENLSDQARLGEGYFNATCASCHGANAAGQDGVAPPLIHRIYEPSHHGDLAFVMAARNGVRAHHWKFGDMPPIEQALSDSELAMIIAYLRELQRANGIH